MLKRDSVIISLLPSGLRVGVSVGGEVARTERIVLDPAGFDDCWAQGLRPLDDHLRAAMSALKIRAGSEVRIVYHSPRTVADVFVAPADAGNAFGAARLYLAQGLPKGGEGWLTGLHVCGAKCVPLDDVTSLGEPSVARTLVLTSADTDENADTMAAWVRRCGLSVARIAPARMVMLRHALSPSADANASAPRIVLWLGEHATTLCGWQDNRVLFARCADVGTSLLADALYRAGRGLGEGFTRAYAHRLLCATGLPVRGQVLDQSHNLRAEAVMPLLQPALQRYIIETRQTLRFSMPEHEVLRATLVARGPGALIPGLADAIGQQLEMAVEVDWESAGNAVSEDEVGDLAIAAELADDSIWVLPPSELTRRIKSKLDIAVKLGGVVVAGGLLALAGIHYARLERLQREILGITPRTRQAADHQSTRAALVERGAIAQQVRGLLDQTLGVRPPWDAVLASLTQREDPDLRLVEVSADFGTDPKAAPVLTLRGVATIEAGSGGEEDTVARFVRVLTESPLVQSAKVMSSHVSVSHAQWESREFVIAAVLRASPSTPPGAAVQSAAVKSDGDGTP